jgi:hypothetical protein
MVMSFVRERIRHTTRNPRRFLLALAVLALVGIFYQDIARFFGITPASAATYQMQTGYYVGDGGSQEISGLGFAPELVIIKADDASGAGAIFKTTAMPGNNTAYLGSATIDDTAGLITLTRDGFRVTGVNSNTANARFTWIAFTGSDCSSGGQFCVGSYTGNGTSPRAITTGFSPDLVWVKAATAVAPNWRSLSMPVNYGQYFAATVQNTAGALYTTLDATGFTVGATNNTSAVVFYYVAFQEASGAIDVGTYTGNGTDGTNITGVGFIPDFVFTKDAGRATGAVYNVTESYGDYSSYFTDTANLLDAIQALQTDGFQLGGVATANRNGDTFYYAAFGGADDTRVTSESFTSVTGSYVGTGNPRIINGLGFTPDLVIIKGNTTQAGVFRTGMMSGDTTAYIDSATANFAGGITALNPDGFALGTAAQVNTNGTIYYWTAYGNAWKPDKNTGSPDFVIGAYTGNGTIDNRDITRLPFSPDLVAVKGNGATAGTWRTTEQSGDLSTFYAATAETANNVQTLNADGFQIGTAGNVNTLATIHWYFGFATGTNFSLGTYSGNGAARTITTSFQPDNVWVKATGATRGVFRTSSMLSSSSAPFINVAPIVNAITGFDSSGFQLGTSAEVNTSGTNNYRYAVWNDTHTVSTSTYRVQTGYYMGNGGSEKITGLGFTPEVVILKADDTSGVGAFLKTAAMPENSTAYLSSATINDTTGLITLQSDGFDVSGVNANTANARYTWIALSGSDCSSTGYMCVGAYAGNGTSPRAITTGFSPDLVWVKAATAVAPNWRSLSMPVNYGQYFTATAQNTVGALFTTLNATDFTVGATNNTAGVTFYYVAFQEATGAVDVGTYTGNGTDNRNIAGVGFVPDFVYTKQTGAVGAVYNVNESYGDNSSYFTDTTSLVNAVQLLQTDGFQVGNNNTANAAATTYYYAAFGSSTEPTANGSFQMTSGTYTGNGTSQVFSDVGFTPDLVIIKGDTTQAGVFRTRVMAGDTTAYLDAASATFAGGITTLQPNGFTIGSNASVNSTGVTYYWTAYGNAYKPELGTGAADFIIGAYTGNATDTRNITRLPFSPDLVAVKQNGATAGTWRTTEHSGDLSSFYSASAEAADNIQALNTDGFQIGTAANVNTAATTYWYFGFATGTNMRVGTYSGTGSSQDIATGIQPNYIWVKQTGATRGVSRSSDLAGDGALPFINVGSVANAITGITSTGFTVNTAAETNTSGSNNYRYAVWKKDGLHLDHYHWRADDDDEANAASLTGGVEDTALSDAKESVPYRLRVEVTNESSVSIPSTGFRIEYGEKAGTCADVSTWTRVGDANGAWDMYDSPNLTEGENTTNISNATGGVTDENTTFLTPNGGVRDTTDETGALTLSGTNFVELEYAMQATQYATDTTTYCFRITSQGTTLTEYSVYPEATFRVHAIATTTGSHKSELIITSTSTHTGGTFVLYDNYGIDTHSITDVVLTESGTVDASVGLENIELWYEYDTTAPHDCASEGYGVGGAETQYGVTDADGFSGANGTSAFAGSVVASSTQAVCFYPVLDITPGATPGETLKISIATTSDILLSGNDIIRYVYLPLSPTGTSTLLQPYPTQMHYHFRLDDGNEAGASSATGGVEDTPLIDLPKLTPRRVRIEVSNEGTATATATYRLEYAERSGTCSATVSGWTDVGAGGGAWEMYNTTNLTDGDDTTNIVVGTGGVTDENLSFVTPNGGVKDTSSQTGSISATTTQFVELEYSIQATANATGSVFYCFRVTNAGVELPQYDQYPEASIATDVVVETIGTQRSVVDASSTNVYIGAPFVVRDRGGSRNVTGITVTETGTVNAQTNLSNIRLYYELDVSNPYTCAGESYDGTEAQYGATSTAFSSANGSSTFTQTVGITTTSALCVYPVLDVDPEAVDGEYIDLEISNPSTQVSISTGTIGPSTPVALSGSTTIEKAALTQIHYHWRNDDGSESGATSATGGVQDTGITNVQRTETERVRLEISNEGSTSSVPTVFTLEYAERSGSCAASTGWATVGTSGAAWVMSDSVNLTDGSDTINISNATGGVTDENGNFLSPNGGVRDTQATTSTLTLTETDFVELEFAIEATTNATFGTTYCFRITGAGTDIASYTSYPQATMRQNQDFYIQRGETTISNGNTTASITAGSNYVAPATNTSAFIRITNTLSTGAGSTAGGTQNADVVTAYVSNPSNIVSGITFTRLGSTGDTRIYWEVVEYIGPSGGDNEIKVRDAQVATFANKSLTVNVAVSGVVNDPDAVVFITGQGNPENNVTEYDTGIATANWNGGTSQAEFTRGRYSAGPGNAAYISFAVVEFTGLNWRVQRAEHTYTAVGTTETESITAVNDLSRAFIHAQHRTDQTTVANLGHLVWLSGVGQVSFALDSGATSPGTHVSVAWIIENTQTNGFPMLVTRSNGSQNADVTEPLTYSIPIGTTLANVNNASIFPTLVGTATDTTHPRAIAGATIASTTHYEFWVSDTGAGRSYRVEVVEWPTAVLTLTQNYYRFYADNNALDPTDPWPVGVTDLGENTTITGYDDPLTNGDVIRIRMSLAVSGSNISQGTKQFSLQYGVRSSSCSAISTWYPVGDTGSTTALWRGYNASPLDGTALSANPPTGGDLNLSVSDRAGTYEEGSPTAPNPYKIFRGDDVEYDWILEANNIAELSTYCFRMVNDSGSEFDAYTYYPTLRSAGFALEQKLWRWYDDETSLTPSSALAATNTAPSNLAQDNALKLRVTLGEYAGSNGNNVKFKLQWSETSSFDVAYDVADFNHCDDNSRWCYYDGAGDDNATITTAVLPDADTCSGGTGDGCGTHNEHPYTIAYIGEVGTTSVDYTGTTVTLDRIYTDPVVIAEAITGDATGGSGNRPAVAVITATTSSSFTVRIQEPDNETDTHGFEDVAYVVMERGAHILPDGTRVDVNSTTTNFYYGNAAAGSDDGVCTFTQTFTNTPAVLTSLQSDNNTGSPDFFTASQLLVTPTDFACSVEVPDDSTLAPTQPETYGWIALSQGRFGNNGILLEATTTSTSITGWTDTPWYEQAFFTEFLNAPGILASKQTRTGADGGWVRYDNADLDSVQLAMDELATPERAHPGESVAYLAFSESGLLYDDNGVSPFVFTANTNREFEFTIRHADAKPNQTYFFRVYDVTNNTPVVPTASSSYPSLSTEGASMSSTAVGITAGNTVEGVTVDVTTTPTSIPFGTLFPGTPVNAAQRFSVTTNATEGYQLLMYESQNLMSGGGSSILDIIGSNASPVSWNVGCVTSAASCYGYHAGDNTLAGGSSRFLLNDTFAPVEGSPSEVAYSSAPVTAETTDVVYRVKANAGQPAGLYESRIIYIVVPVF